MSDTKAWYVVKQDNGQCLIVSGSDVEPLQTMEEPASSKHWGPYDSQQEAIARRVGLIRAGKCHPV